MAAADGTWATSVPTRPRRDLVLALAVPLVLTIIAGVQATRAVSLHQSSWSGAGFGMFATWDNEDSRFVRAYLRTADGRERLPIPADLADVVFDAKVVPTDQRLATIARRLLERLDPVPAGAAVEVEVWAIRVEGADERLNVSAAPQWTATVAASS